MADGDIEVDLAGNASEDDLHRDQRERNERPTPGTPGRESVSDQ